MKQFLTMAITLAMVLGFVSLSQADITMQASLEWDFPSASGFNITNDNISDPGNFGRIEYYDYSTSPATHTLFGIGSYNTSTWIGTLSDPLGNQIGAAWDPETAAGKVSATAVSDSVDIERIASTEIILPNIYLGEFTILPTFSYTYSALLDRDYATDSGHVDISIWLSTWNISLNDDGGIVYGDDGNPLYQQSYETIFGPDRWVLLHGEGANSASVTDQTVIIPEQVSANGYPAN